MLTMSIPPDETMIVTLRVSDLREVVRAAIAEALAARGEHDLLDMKQIAERYGIGRGAVQAAARRGELELSQGPRRRLLVRAGEVDRWLTHRKYAPPSSPAPRALHDACSEGTDAIERALAAGRLRKLSPREAEESKERLMLEQAERKRIREAKRQ